MIACMQLAYSPIVEMLTVQRRNSYAVHNSLQTVGKLGCLRQLQPAEV